MNRNYGKKVKKLLCWCCVFSLCIASTAMAAANIGDVYTLGDGSLSLRVCGGGDAVVVCGYDGSNSDSVELNINSGYRLCGPDGNIHKDENGNEISFRVIGIEDGVFAGNQNFTYINIEAGTGMKIGKSAFENVQVKAQKSWSWLWGWTEVEKGVDINAEELTEIGESAFAGADIKGNMTIRSMNGSIEAGAFKNLNMTGNLRISGKIDKLGDYALSGMSINGITVPADICHMGDGVYKDTYLGKGIIVPLSNSLKTIGSRVFEGTEFLGVELPECDTVEYAADDAFEEGMLIVIPEGLTNLEVFHFDKYQNLTFQTAEGLSDDSPVIQYLKKNRLVYRKGANGELIYPEIAEEPTEAPKATEAPTKEPEVTEEPTDEPKPTDEPSATDTPIEEPKPSDEPTNEPKVTDTPTDEPKPTDEPSVTDTPIEEPKPSDEPTNEPKATEPPIEESKPTKAPESTETPTATEPPKAAETATPTESPKPVETPKATTTPGPTATSRPTATPRPTVTPKPTATSNATTTPRPTATPKATPRPTVTPKPTVIPNATATPKPTETPKPIETLKPTETPTAINAVISDETSTIVPVITSIPEPTKNPAETSDTLNQVKKNGIYSVGGLKYNLLGKNKVAVTGSENKNSIDISIPETVTINEKTYQVVKIKKQAFKGMKNLKNVKIGNGVKKIGNEAFAKCSKLKSIQLGTGLVNIGEKAFYKDKNIRKIVFKGTKLSKIGKKTFSGIQSKKIMIEVKWGKLKYYQKLINKAR